MPNFRSRFMTAALPIILLLGGCAESTAELPETATPVPPTSTHTPTPTITLTPTPTATPTPIPPPEGTWTQYWNHNDYRDLLLDTSGYLWGLGHGGILRWDTQEKTHREIGVEDSLPGAVADEIFLGPEGRVWLAYDGYGLWRQDETSWTGHFTEGEPEGEQLYAQASGPDGTLWICTPAGLSQFKGGKWTRENFALGNPAEWCSDLTVDLDGVPLLIGSKGISFFQDGELQAFTTLNRKFNFTGPIGAFTAPNGDVWFAATRDHPVWYDRSEERFKYQDPGPIPYSLTIGTYGQVWMIEMVNFSTFDLYRLTGNFWQKVPYDNQLPDRMYELFPGVQGEIWIRTQEGLVLIQNNTFTLFEDISGGHLIPFDAGKTYLEVQDGIGTFQGGEITDVLTVESDLLTNRASNLAAANGMVWITSGGDLQSYDGDTWTLHDLPGSSIKDLAANPAGDIWVSYRPSGLSHWNKGSWTHYNAEDITALPDKSAEEITINPDGTAWFAYEKEGAAHFEDGSWSFYPFNDEEASAITGLIEAPDGTVLLSNRIRNRIYQLKGDTWTYTEVDFYPRGLYQGPDGTVWITTLKDGLFQWRAGKAVPVEFPGSRVDDIAFSADGSTWAATQNGAWRFDGYQWFPYKIQDGLRTNKLTAVAADPEGAVWFAGGGLTRLLPEQ